MDRFASGGIRKVDPRWKSPGHHRGRIDLYLRGRDRNARSDPLHRASSRARRSPRSGIEIRRGLYGRRRRGRAGLDRRRFLPIVLGQPREGLPARAGLRWVIRYLYRQAQQFNPRGASAAQRRTPLRS